MLNRLLDTRVRIFELQVCRKSRSDIIVCDSAVEKYMGSTVMAEMMENFSHRLITTDHAPIRDKLY